MLPCVGFRAQRSIFNTPPLWITTNTIVYFVSVIWQIVLHWGVLGKTNISSHLWAPYTTPPNPQHLLIIQQILRRSGINDVIVLKQMGTFVLMMLSSSNPTCDASVLVQSCARYGIDLTTNFNKRCARPWKQNPGNLCGRMCMLCMRNYTDNQLWQRWNTDVGECFIQIPLLASMAWDWGNLAVQIRNALCSIWDSSLMWLWS